MKIQWGRKKAPEKCIICGGKLEFRLAGLWDTRLGSRGRFRIVGCEACGLEQTLPRLSEKRLSVLYRRYYGEGEDGLSLYYRFREAFLLSTPYRFWMALDGDMAFHSLCGPGRLLDVGCNVGRSLEIFRRRGFKAEGIETNSQAACTARERGFAVHSGRIESFSQGCKYDVIVLANVLEHTADPARALARVRRALKPGGSMYLSCPNGESWFRALFGRRWVNWHTPFHSFHFSDQALRRLLLDAGFVRVRTRNVTPALWVAQSLIACIFARKGRRTRSLHNPFLLGTLMLLIRCLLFPILWFGNILGYGDCLRIVAKRPAVSKCV